MRDFKAFERRKSSIPSLNKIQALLSTKLFALSEKHLKTQANSQIWPPALDRPMQAITL